VTDAEREGVVELAGIVEYLIVALLPKTARADKTDLLARLDAARNKVKYGENAE